MHAHFGTDAIEALRLSRRLGIPLVATFHGFDATVGDGYLAAGSFVERRYLAQRDTLIRSDTTFLAVSEFIRQQLILRGFPPERIQVHYTGVDTRLFSPPAVAARRPHVLFVARLVAKKGVRHLLNAIAHLHDQVPGLEVTIVGDGPERSLVERAAASYPCIRFLGEKAPEDVRALLREAKVFCVPSITGPNGDAEGFGMVFAEAQAMGVPVVSFASGGVVEAVSDRETGLLAPEGNTSELTRHLHALLTLEDEDWARLSRRSREYVLETFDLERQTAKLEELYSSLLLPTGSLILRSHAER
jgi:glycosyltransferase involved in cell wall biosynthesis